MTAAARHQRIVEVLTERNRATVGELAAIADASEMTIRRDLEALENLGVLRRVHGGAVNLLLSGVEAPYAIRAMAAPETKAKIAAAVAGLLEDGETVVLDSGTTAVAVARAMRERRLTVTPLSLHATEELSRQESIHLLMAGGKVRPGELSFHGEMTERVFTDLCYDTFVMGCCGVDVAAGATAHTLEDVPVKRAAIRAARRTIAVVTADKLGRVTFGRICPLEKIDLIVTDAEPGLQHVEDLRAAGASILHV